MITKDQKNKIIEILGHRYVASVQKELKLLNATDRNNNPYSSSLITNVMNSQSHKVVEEAIWTAVRTRKEINKKNEEVLKSA